MDEFLQSIKQKFSMENIIETIKDELEDTNKPIPEELNKVEPTEQLLNLSKSIDKIMDSQTKSTEPVEGDMKKPSNNILQTKQPSTNTGISVLQKPNPPEEVKDPFNDNENLFSFCD